MNLHHLELFYYVARHRGISRAVARMPYGIQQPAISAQLLRLEEQLGTQLFRRRPFALTAAGEELYCFVRPFFEGLPEVARRLQGGDEPELRIAASTTVLAHFFPLVVEDLRLRHPGLRLTLQQMGAIEAEQGLLAGDIDVAISAELARAPAGLHGETLLDVPLALVVRDDDPLRGFDDLPKEGSVITAPLVSLVESEPLVALFRRELERRGLEWKPRIVVSQLELVQAYVRAGFGVGLTADVPMLRPGKGLRRIGLPGFPGIRIEFFHRGVLSPAARQLLELARKLAGEIQRAAPGEEESRRPAPEPRKKGRPGARRGP
ncbi:MAG TPA: LysR family transcriptional regulator [Verrucomicrobiales bacterium]|nr:LysR family transcriptional regulator [Verrucomicrobiales bacterium]